MDLATPMPRPTDFAAALGRWACARSPSRRMLFSSLSRTLAVAAAAVLILLVGLGGGQAAAHTGLETSAPADDEVLTSLPEAVSLTFTEEVRAQFSQVVVTGPDGQSINAGPATIEGPVVRQPVSGDAVGEHVVAYRVVSGDGHPVSGQLTFTLTGARTATATETAESSQSGSPASRSDAAAPSPAAGDSDSGWTSGWGAALAVAVALTAMVLLAVRSRRQSPRRRSQ